MEELLARINALLRRVSNQNKSLKYKYGEIEIDVINHHAKFKDDTITLTTTEFDSLSLLVKNGGNIVTKNDILNKVWGYEKNVSTNVVEVYIRYLRNKLVGINIETIRGIGYRLV
ncbi:MAG: winged helix-turn-helix domain-containing protein [Thomasclavelia sp.]